MFSNLDIRTQEEEWNRRNGSFMIMHIMKDRWRLDTVRSRGWWEDGPLSPCLSDLLSVQQLSGWKEFWNSQPVVQLTIGYRDMGPGGFYEKGGWLLRFKHILKFEAGNDSFPVVRLPQAPSHRTGWTTAELFPQNHSLGLGTQMLTLYLAPRIIYQFYLLKSWLQKC